MNNDILIRCDDVPWTQVYEGIWIKDLRSCDVTGQWTQLLKMEAGTVLPAHFHLGAGEFYVVKGEFVYRGGTARTGDYGYEPIGALHEAPRAAVETILFYVGYGPLVLLNADGTVRGVMGSRCVNEFQSQAGAAQKPQAA